MSINNSIYLALKDVISLDDERAYFGRYISSGEFTIVYKLDYPFVPQNIRDKFKSPVLVITADKGKMEILSSLINSNFYQPNFSDLEAEDLKSWLYENDFDTIEEANEECYEFRWSEYASDFDLYPFLSRISSEKGLNVFFMEEAEEVYYDPFIFEKIEDLFLNNIFSGNLNGNAGHFIKQLNQFKFDKNLVEEFKEHLGYSYNDFINLFKIVKRDILKACKTDVLSRSFLSLDLHDKQFIELDNKIYLSDAFIY